MGKEKGQRYTAEQKLEILREAEQPGVTISAGGTRCTAQCLLRLARSRELA